MQNQFILTPYFMDEYRPEMARIAKPDWQINDMGLALPGDDLLAKLSAVHRPASAWVEQAARAGQRPVTVAGDCCSAIPMLAGLQRAGIQPFLIWMDAHGDYNTFETSPTGYIFGMPFAMMCGLGDQRLPQAVGLRTLPPTQAVLTDGRDLDPGERDLVLSSGLPWAKQIEHVSAQLPSDAPIWVHFDTDVLDPSDSPNMLYRVPDGPSLAALISAAKAWAGTGRIVAVSMTTWTFAQDEDRRSERACMAVLDALLQ